MGKEKKTVMGKNARIIIFSLIGLAVLGAVAAVLMLTAPQKQEEPQESILPSSTSSATGFTLSDREAKDVKSLTVTNAGGTFTITPSGNTDENGDVIWTIADIAAAPLDTSSLELAVEYAAKFEAREFAEKVSDPSELAKYGLDAPTATVKAQFTDGTEFGFTLGSDVPSSDTSVYMTADGESVYTAYKSRTDSYKGEKYDFVSCSAMPAYDQSGTEEVKLFTVERYGQEPIVLENILTDEPDAIQVYSYRMTSPYSAYADLTNGPTFVYSIFGLNALKVIEVGEISDEKRVEYGLETPFCKVTAQTNLKTYTLTLGTGLFHTETDDEGKEYEALDGVYGTSSEHPGIVYLFDESTIMAASADPAKLISKLFLMPYIYDLDTIEYRDNTGRSMTLGVKMLEAAEANKDIVGEYTVNGEKWDEQKFKNLYQYLISAAGEEIYFDSDKGALIAEITYNYLDKSDGVDGKDVVRFYESNSDRKTIIELNGKNLFKTRQLYTTQLFKNVESFLAGGDITLTY